MFQLFSWVFTIITSPYVYLHFLQSRSVHNTVMELRNICNHPYLSQLHSDEVLLLQKDILGIYCSINPGPSVLLSLCFIFSSSFFVLSWGFMKECDYYAAHQ